MAHKVQHTVGTHRYGEEWLLVRGDALHRDAQSASSPQPPVQELSMVLRWDPMYWALPSVKAGTVLGDRSASCVNTSMDARQRDCHTRKINCLLSVVVVLKYYTFKGVSKC